MFGLEPTGFSRKQYSDIVSDMETRARGLFGEDVNLAERSPLGMLIRLFSWSVGILWQLAEKVYFSGYADTAEGVSLDYVAKYIGINRFPAQRATGVVTFTGTEGTIIPEGFLVETVDGIQFETVEEVVIGVSTTVDVDVIALIVGVDGNVADSMITQIVNPIAGLDTVTNAVALLDGRNVESDVEFRERYQRSVAKVGSSTVASIESTILDIEGVVDALVRENDQIIEVDGIPAKSISAIVAGGDNTDIALAILSTKAGGIQSFGTTTVTVQDSRGVDFDIGFTRPTPVLTDVAITLTTDATFPTDGETTISTEIEEYINGLGIGQNVIYTKVISLCHVVEGVTNAVVTINGLGANLIIGDDEISQFDGVVFT